MELAVPRAADERRYPRLRNPGIQGKVPQRIGVRLVDISVSGVGIESLVPLGNDVHYRLVLDNQNRHIERDASLIWNRLERTSRSRLGEIAPVYRSGLAFAPGDPGAARELMLFMHEVGPEPKRNMPQVREDTSLDRAATRYALTKGFKLCLDAEPEFTIQSLSLSGLLVETRVRLAQDSIVTLFLRLPDSVVEATAKVVGLERASVGRPARYLVALQFMSVSSEGRSDMARFLEERLESQSQSGSGFHDIDSATDLTAVDGGRPSQAAQSAPASQKGAGPLRAPAGWILPTLASLLGLGVLLTSVSGEAIREISGQSAWPGQHAVALSWSLKLVGALLVGVAGFLGLRWLLGTRTSA